MCDTISVDQKNDLAATREKIGPDKVILGNVHPWDVFSQGTPEQIREEVAKAAAAGVDAVWPGCDLWPDTPIDHLKVWLEASHEQTPRRKA
jgi:[methyl-Co(III) methanol-specific corrinoid protein]:coenzyme M methyltransferase